MPPVWGPARVLPENVLPVWVIVTVWPCVPVKSSAPITRPPPSAPPSFVLIALLSEKVLSVNTADGDPAAHSITTNAPPAPPCSLPPLLLKPAVAVSLSNVEEEIVTAGPV